MAAKLIRLRYAGSCARCGVGLPVGTQAWWEREAHTTTCVACCPPRPDRSADLAPIEPPPLVVGEAGASARLEYEKRHARREQRIDERWGGLAGIVKFLSDDPQSTRAWATGSAGEKHLAQRLLREVGDRAVLFHDRKVPGTRGNIDHLAVAASGVWVIDAKNYRGLVERTDIGGWLKTDYRLSLKPPRPHQSRAGSRRADRGGWPRPVRPRGSHQRGALLSRCGVEDVLQALNAGWRLRHMGEEARGNDRRTRSTPAPRWRTTAPSSRLRRSRRRSLRQKPRLAARTVLHTACRTPCSTGILPGTTARRGRARSRQASRRPGRHRPRARSPRCARASSRR